MKKQKAGLNRTMESLPPDVRLRPCSVSGLSTLCPQPSGLISNFSSCFLGHFQKADTLVKFLPCELYTQINNMFIQVVNLSIQIIIAKKEELAVRKAV